MKVIVHIMWYSMLHKVVLTFESLGVCGYSNKTYWAVYSLNSVSIKVVLRIKLAGISRRLIQAMSLIEQCFREVLLVSQINIHEFFSIEIFGHSRAL